MALRVWLAALVFPLLLEGAAAAGIDVPVSFQVVNQNGSRVPCLADGQTYTVSGRLVSPSSDIGRQSVALYLHGLGFGKWFWSFPGLDFAADMTARGHASVVIDRLGYDDSGHPLGYLTCLGAQADVAHQIIAQLKSGNYTVDGGSPVTFGNVALLGHSGGGAVAQVTADSFPNVDALVVLSYADQGASMAALNAFGGVAVQCATGGSSPEGSPAGYAAFGQTDAEFQALMFHKAKPSVVAAATAMRNLDPCGDDASIPLEVVTSNLFLRSFTKPVLILCGKQDAIFPPPACEDQTFLYPDGVELIEIDGIGHALTLEKKARVFRAELSNWLTRNGF